MLSLGEKRKCPKTELNKLYLVSAVGLAIVKAIIFILIMDFGYYAVSACIGQRSYPMSALGGLMSVAVFGMILFGQIPSIVRLRIDADSGPKYSITL